MKKIQVLIVTLFLLTSQLYAQTGTLTKDIRIVNMNGDTVSVFEQLYLGKTVIFILALALLFFAALFLLGLWILGSFVLISLFLILLIFKSKKLS